MELDKAKDYDGVIAGWAGGAALYPEYVGEANAYEYMAEAHLAKDDKKDAAAV